MTEEQRRFLTSPESLREMAPRSLFQRCQLFALQFPGRTITRYVLGKLYKQEHIKKKVVLTRNIAARHEERREEFAERTLKLSDFMERLYADKAHILYLDECVFAARGYS